ALQAPTPIGHGPRTRISTQASQLKSHGGNWSGVRYGPPSSALPYCNTSRRHQLPNGPPHRLASTTTSTGRQTCCVTYEPCSSSLTHHYSPPNGCSRSTSP